LIQGNSPRDDVPPRIARVQVDTVVSFQRFDSFDLDKGYFPSGIRPMRIGPRSGKVSIPFNSPSCIDARTWNRNHGGTLPVSDVNGNNVAAHEFNVGVDVYHGASGEIVVIIIALFSLQLSTTQ
jgi:hypothetical protein